MDGGQDASQEQIRLPAPLGGLNTSTSFLYTPSTDALELENFIIRPFGLEIRRGWRYWYNTAFPAPVVSLLAYIGTQATHNKLFAATAETGAGKHGPLYDVTTSAAAPPGAVALAGSTAPDVPGEWSSTMFVTDGGAYLCAVQAGAGYYTYTNGVGWVEVPTGGGAGQLLFPDATTTKDLAFIMVWKERLWFIARNSTKAYYLPVKQVTGTVSLYNFGSLFTHGGYLQLLLRWTYDGGNGMDDGLVVLSDQGDMLIYQGTDPAAAATFGLKGTWYAGRMPVGRRNYTQQGGDLWLITEYGVISVSDLVSGRVTAPTQESTDSGKYNPTLAEDVSDTLTEKYWFLKPYANGDIMVCGSPHISELYGYRVSYMMAALAKGWSTTQNFDPYCAEVFEGKFMFGDRDGYLKHGFMGFRDGDSFDSAILGSEPTARMVTGFHDLGSPTLNKTATRIRLVGLSEGAVSFKAVMLNEYEMGNLLSIASPGPGSGSLWDVGIWDESLWALSHQTFRKWYGVAGFGKKLALQLAIRGLGYTFLSDYEITFKKGNGL